MSVNKNKPHVLLLPEDDANQQIANGFQLGVDLAFSRQFQVLPEVGGWIKVLECFQEEHIWDMARIPKRFMVLLIDLDRKQSRIQEVKDKIPGDLVERVFVLGSLKDPESLRADLGTYETIGLALANDCREGSERVWSHKLLRHNAPELERLRQYVRPILFP